MSVSGESPTMTTRSRPAFTVLNAISNIAGKGLPTTTGSRRVVALTASTMAPVPGRRPLGEGKDPSALVATKRAPSKIQRAACRMCA